MAQIVSESNFLGRFHYPEFSSQEEGGKNCKHDLHEWLHPGTLIKHHLLWGGLVCVWKCNLEQVLVCFCQKHSRTWMCWWCCTPRTEVCRGKAKAKALINLNFLISQSSSESIRAQQTPELIAIQNVKAKGVAVREKQPGDGKQVILNFPYHK